MVVVGGATGSGGPVTRGVPMNSKCIPSGVAQVPPHAKPCRRKASTMRRSITGGRPKRLVEGLMSMAAAHECRDRFFPDTPPVLRISRPLKQPPDRAVSRTSISGPRPASSISRNASRSAGTMTGLHRTVPMIGSGAGTTCFASQAGSMLTVVAVRRTKNSPRSAFRCGCERTPSTRGLSHERRTNTFPTRGSSEAARASRFPLGMSQSTIRDGCSRARRAAVDGSMRSSAPAASSSGTIAPIVTCSTSGGPGQCTSSNTSPTFAARSAAEVFPRTASPFVRAA